MYQLGNKEIMRNTFGMIRDNTHKTIVKNETQSDPVSSGGHSVKSLAQRFENINPSQNVQVLPRSQNVQVLAEGYDIRDGNKEWSRGKGHSSIIGRNLHEYVEKKSEEIGNKIASDSSQVSPEFEPNHESTYDKRRKSKRNSRRSRRRRDSARKRSEQLSLQMKESSVSNHHLKQSYVPDSRRKYQTNDFYPEGEVWTSKQKEDTSLREAKRTERLPHDSVSKPPLFFDREPESLISSVETARCDSSPCPESTWKKSDAQGCRYYGNQCDDEDYDSNDNNDDPSERLPSSFVSDREDNRRYCALNQKQRAMPGTREKFDRNRIYFNNMNCQATTRNRELPGSFSPNAESGCRVNPRDKFFDHSRSAHARNSPDTSSGRSKTTFGVSLKSQNPVSTSSDCQKPKYKFPKCSLSDNVLEQIRSGRVKLREVQKYKKKTAKAMKSMVSAVTKSVLALTDGNHRISSHDIKHDHRMVSMQGPNTSNYNYNEPINQESAHKSGHGLGSFWQKKQTETDFVEIERIKVTRKYVKSSKNSYRSASLQDNVKSRHLDYC